MSDPAQMALVGAGFLLLLHQLETTRSGRRGRNCTIARAEQKGRGQRASGAQGGRSEDRTPKASRPPNRAAGPMIPEGRWSAASEADCGRATARAPCSALAHLDPLGSGRPWD